MAVLYSGRLPVLSMQSKVKTNGIYQQSFSFVILGQLNSKYKITIHLMHMQKKLFLSTFMDCNMKWKFFLEEMWLQVYKFITLRKTKYIDKDKHLLRKSWTFPVLSSSFCVTIILLIDVVMLWKFGGDLQKQNKL